MLTKKNLKEYLKLYKIFISLERGLFNTNTTRLSIFINPRIENNYYIYFEKVISIESNRECCEYPGLSNVNSFIYGININTIVPYNYKSIESSLKQLYENYPDNQIVDNVYET